MEGKKAHLAILMSLWQKLFTLNCANESGKGKLKVNFKKEFFSLKDLVKNRLTNRISFELVKL